MSLSRVNLAVFNISWTCTRRDLRSYFEKFGKVVRINIPMNANGFNQKTAFVDMTGEQGFADKIMTDYHVIDGTEVHVGLQHRQNDQYNVTERRKL
ncbi:hypothetical protein BsWGS_10818 [Bradybaena similaris]